MRCLDIETASWFTRGDPRPREEQLRDQKFAIAVTYDDQTGEYIEWTKKDLIPLWHYLLTDTITGFNIIDFDLPVIRYNMPPGTILPEKQPVCYDIFAEIRHHTTYWFSLNAVLIANNLGAKTADGLQAAQWLAEYERTQDEALLRKALDYCRNDVALEYALYKFLADGNELWLPPIKDMKRGIMYKKDGSVRFVDQKEGAA